MDLTKNHQFLASANVFASGQSAAQPVAPYQQAFPLNSTWDYTFKSYFTYDLPYRLEFGMNYQFLAGAPAYATDQFTVPNLGTVTIPVDRYGSHRAPSLNVMNLRVGRVTPLGRRFNLETTVELFNVLNVAPGTTVNFINGAGTKAFGYTSVYMAPMVGRFGAQLRF